MTAIVTGSSSGIGRAVTLALINEKINVIGISRSSSGIISPLFKEILMDLGNIGSLTEIINDLRKTSAIDILINNAGCAYFGLHEEINAAKIHEMVTTNLEVPLVLTGLLLRDLKSVGGTIINISSVTAKNINPHGAAYGATKAALSSFGNSIFAEARKNGVRVANIHPEMTDTNLYRNADFEADTSDSSCLFPKNIADLVVQILHAPSGFTINDITVNPQYHRIKRK